MYQKKIAITGGIGSGKSTVARIIKERGFPVFSCDEIYQDVIKSAEYIEKIAQIFPNAVENNIINRQTLAKIVFSDNEARKQLNSIAHPLIMENLFSKMEKSESTLVFAEVPLLFEEKLEGFFDEIWVVFRDLEDRICSTVLRDHCDREDVIQRINAQFNYDSVNSRQYLKQMNAHIIDNCKGEAELQNIIDSLLKQ